jgi:hypothetical protein
MSVYDIQVPSCNTIDALAEQRDARDQRTRARMSRKAYIDAILEGVRDAIETHGNPLCELADMLFEAPVRDRYDCNAFLAMRDSRRAGKAIMTLVAEASLESYQSADNEGF